MTRTAAENALATAERMAAFSEVAAAWAANEFETVTPKEAWHHGWDAESDTPQIFNSDTASAIWDEANNEISICDADGDLWGVNPNTGEIKRVG